MTLVQRNILANFVGNIWIGLTYLAFIPLYIKFVGIEGFGLISLFTTFLAIFALLDMGFSSTLNREIARLTFHTSQTRKIRSLVRTLEIPYWIIGIIIGVVTISVSPFIAFYWINSKDLSPETVERSVLIMGIVLVCHWPIAFYSGGLMGLQRQVLLNAVNVAVATFRGVGAIIVLWLISSSVESFFKWQILVSSAHTGILVYLLWHYLPHSDQKPKFCVEIFKDVWRYAFGVTGITLSSTILMQLDKIILSRMLDLETFGYYTLSCLIAMSLFRLVYPIVTAVFPKFTNLVSSGNWNSLIRVYHGSCQLVSVIILPTSLIIAIFSPEILLLWTRDASTVQNSHLLVTVLVIGTALNGLMNIPTALQLASGWTTLALNVNLVSISILAPLMFLLTHLFGALGAASAWIILNLGYVLITIPIMHRRLLTKEKWKWYIQDVGIPLIVSLIVSGTFRFCFKVPEDFNMLLIYTLAVSILTLLSVFFLTSVTRDWLKEKLRKLRPYDAVS